LIRTGISPSLSGLPWTTAPVISFRPAHETTVALREKLVGRNLPVPFAIQFLQDLRGVFQLLGIDDSIVIRVQKLKDAGQPATIARSTTALAIRSRPAGWQALWRIRWLWGCRRRGSRTALLREERGRRQRDGGEEKRLEVLHKGVGFWGFAATCGRRFHLPQRRRRH
jgi:hypothetical protein